MKFKIVVLVLLLALGLTATSAQVGTTSTVGFNGFSFSFDSTLAQNVNIVQYAGDDTTLEVPGGPQSAHTIFLLYNDSPAPQTFFESNVGAVHLYRMDNMTGFSQQETEALALQNLLTQRPDVATFMTVDVNDASANTLPFLPVFPSAQVVRAQAHYVDTPQVNGIAYITAYRIDVSPLLANDFFYTFQGISADGQFYVSAIFKLNTTLFPTQTPADFDSEAFGAQMGEYLNTTIGQLNEATPDAFVPSLVTLETIVQTFDFGLATVTPVAPQPTVEPTQAVSDPTFGGLGGPVWTLVSYGPPEAPIPVAPGVPVTITFAETGVSGNASCNSFGGAFQYDLTNGSLSLSNMVSTLMACAEPAMSQEIAVMTAFQTVNRFQRGEGQLLLFYEGGVLNFLTLETLLLTPSPEVTETPGS